MSLNSMAFKQKKRLKNTRNKYLKPGALAQICYNKTSSKSCTDIGKKRTALESEKEEIGLTREAEVIQSSNTPVMSPTRVSSQPAIDEAKHQKLPGTPKTPQSAVCDRRSRLETLPMDLLIKILCHLHHDQLRAVFHVSQRIRTAVLMARQLHFNYTTPDRSRQEMLRNKTPFQLNIGLLQGRKGTWGSSPHTPKAPRHGCRSSRLHLMDMKQIAAVLFQEPTLPPRHMMPPCLSRPVFKPIASTRVLFYEDELCQAVAQNKLR